MKSQGSFSFSFLTPNASRRLSPCRERVVYPLLVAVCRGFGDARVRHCFFSSLLGVLPPRLPSFFVLFPPVFASSAFYGFFGAFQLVGRRSPATSSSCSS